MPPPWPPLPLSPVHHVLAVRVLQGLAELTDQRQLGVETQRVGLFGQPQVEALPVGIVRVDQSGAEFGVDVVLGTPDRVVVEVLHHRHLMCREQAQVATNLLRGAFGGDPETDPATLVAEVFVGGEPVLPARPVLQWLLVQEVGADLSLMGAQTDELDDAGDGGLMDPGAWSGEAIEDVGDRVQAGRGGLGQAIKVAASDLGEFADQVGVVQEHRGRMKGMTSFALGRPGSSDCLRAQSSKAAFSFERSRFAFRLDFPSKQGSQDISSAAS